MNEQLQLEIPPASHRHDPPTSKAAEHRANISGQALQVYTALRAHGPATMRELADKSGIDYYVCQRRISVLHNNNLAERTGSQENPDTGNHCSVWRAL